MKYTALCVTSFASLVIACSDEGAQRVITLEPHVELPAGSASSLNQDLSVTFEAVEDLDDDHRAVVWIETEEGALPLGEAHDEATVYSLTDLGVALDDVHAIRITIELADEELPEAPGELVAARGDFPGPLVTAGLSAHDFEGATGRATISEDDVRIQVEGLPPLPEAYFYAVWGTDEPLGPHPHDEADESDHDDEAPDDMHHDDVMDDMHHPDDESLDDMHHNEAVDHADDDDQVDHHMDEAVFLGSFEGSSHASRRGTHFINELTGVMVTIEFLHGHESPSRAIVLDGHLTLPETEHPQVDGHMH